MSSIFVKLNWLEEALQPADVTLSNSKSDRTFIKSEQAHRPTQMSYLHCAKKWYLGVRISFS